MKLLLVAPFIALSAVTLAGCAGQGAGPMVAQKMDADDAALGVSLPLAPVTPKDDRSHGDLERITGINGDAVPAVSGNANQSYIYYDAFAANRQALSKAPARLCASYGKQLKSSRTTEPADREPGIKVLAVQCQ